MNKTLWQYFVDAAATITDHALDGIDTLDQWERERPRRRDEFLRSMGLHDAPTCDLAVTQHGEFAGPGYRALRLAYQLLPGVWSTGNLLLPDPLPAGLLPAVLFANGHNSSAVGDTSELTLVWPRRGYACFVFDTIQQTDNPGSHRGLHSGGRQDWIARGYTAAGGELLNGLRAFDVLAGRPEVDPQRIGVTGRSGGGAQSFFIAVAQERVAAAVPIVGVASLKRTIADRGYRDQCDCMYALGLHQRDNIDFAALLAPRPVLFCYGQADTLFSPDEYRRLVENTRRIYRLYGRQDHCRLLEHPGPHGQIEPPASETCHWFDAHLLGSSKPVVPVGKREIDERRGSVFNGKRPVPDRLDLLPELLSNRASHPLPREADEWPAIRAGVVGRLRENVFGWLDRTHETAAFEHRCHNRYRGDIGSMEVWLESPAPSHVAPKRIVLAVCDVDQPMDDLAMELSPQLPGEAIAYLEPRATGLNAPLLGRGRRQVERVGALLGLTLPLLWMNDLRHTLAFLRGLPSCADAAIYLCGKGDAGAACLYHGILNEDIAGVFLIDPPDSHLRGGCIPAILREMEITSAVGLMAPRPVGIACSRLSDWYALRWGHRVYHRLGMPERHALGQTVAEVREVVLRPTPSQAGGGDLGK
jgi:dienelactone hydrolase